MKDLPAKIATAIAAMRPIKMPGWRLELARRAMVDFG
jgi:hypothetical protein